MESERYQDTAWRACSPKRSPAAARARRCATVNSLPALKISPLATRVCRLCRFAPQAQALLRPAPRGEVFRRPLPMHGEGAEEKSPALRRSALQQWLRRPCGPPQSHFIERPAGRSRASACMSSLRSICLRAVMQAALSLRSFACSQSALGGLLRSQRPSRPRAARSAGWCR